MYTSLKSEPTQPYHTEKRRVHAGTGLRSFQALWFRIFTTRFQFQYILHISSICIARAENTLIHVCQIEAELARRRFMLPRQGTTRR